MGNKKAEEMARKRAKAIVSPALYNWDLEDSTPAENADTLSMLFHSQEWIDKLERRKHIYQSMDRMKDSGFHAALKQIEAADRWFADRMLQACVLRSVQVTHREKKEMLEYYKELPTDKETFRKRDELSRLVNSTVFLADLLESYVTDINSKIHDLFKDKSMNCEQMDGVTAALRQMHDFFGATRMKMRVDEQDLFAEYAESITKYVDKRMKTYAEKAAKIKAKNPNNKK